MTTNQQILNLGHFWVRIGQPQSVFGTVLLWSGSIMFLWQLFMGQLNFLDRFGLGRFWSGTVLVWDQGSKKINGNKKQQISFENSSTEIKKQQTFFDLFWSPGLGQVWLGPGLSQSCPIWVIYLPYGMYAIISGAI